MELMKIQKVLYKAFALVNLVIAIYFMLYTINLSKGYELWDFQVFYGAIRNVIAGSSIYTRYGAAILPFWYFPWVAWLFLPLAFFPFEIASYLFLAAGLTITALVIHFLAKHYQSFDLFDRIYMFSMVIWLSWLVYRVGQMSYFVLGGAVLVMFLLARQRNYLAGLCIPLLLMKPHLFIIFLPLVLWMGGWKTFLSGTVATLGLFGIEFLITPDWVRQMLTLLTQGVGSMDVNPFYSFTTLPTLLGFNQNITGTANLPMSAVLVVIAALVVIRFRSLPKIPLLSFAMAASLFCAPRAYAYDLVLLIPAMIWLSEKWSVKTALIWVVAALIPLLSHFSAISYLVTLMVFALCVYKAYSIEKHSRVPALLPQN
jgi:Glycosyltransferase family 87